MTKSLFQQKHPFSKRVSESSRVLAKYPDRVPIICEESYGAHTKTSDGAITKVKFLVPSELTVAQFMFVLRQRIQLSPVESIFLFFQTTHTTPCSAHRMMDIYHQYKDEDGFLYLTWSRENTFGASDSTVVSFCIVVMILALVWIGHWMLPSPLTWDSGQPGPTILILAGTHGDEAEIVSSLPLWIQTPRRGKIVLIAPVSPSAYFLGQRLTWDGVDINRSYPHASNHWVPTHWINEFLLPYIHRADVILDFHEAHAAHRDVPTSMGCAVWPGKMPLSSVIATNMVADLQTFDPRWCVGTWNPQTDHVPTLRSYLNDVAPKTYLLVEMVRDDTMMKKMRIVTTVLSHLNFLSH